VSETITIAVEEVLHETAKALLVRVDEVEVWVPKSLIGEDSECYSQKSGPGDMIVPEWWARENGLT
jgi:hypothetical protein